MKKKKEEDKALVLHTTIPENSLGPKSPHLNNMACACLSADTRPLVRCECYLLALKLPAQPFLHTLTLAT